MKTRISLFLMIACALFIALTTGQAGAATVRGKLIHSNGGQPAAGVQVTIYRTGKGRSAPTSTDANGMFNLYNVAAGACFLEVWTTPGKQPTEYQIEVVEPYKDLPVVSIP